MPISIAEAILQGANKLRKAGVPEARREAGSLLAFLLDKDRTFILGHADHMISSEQETLFDEFVEARAQGEPAQYITGRQDFYGLEFEVTPAVLIPRPETEVLIETAIKLVGTEKAFSFCDVGTGSGCIAVTLLHQFPLARATAVDVSGEALVIAGRNASRHRVSDRIEFVVSDCFASVGPQSFDLIVSNPPYVAEDAVPTLQREVRDFEPRVALTAGADGLDVIRRLVTDSQKFLGPGGHLVFEIGFDQHEVVRELIDARVWELLDIHQDLQGIPRTVALQKK
ncbi:MAG TPA: peptide chain release factor N(5)-glutamine methyltransferase [Pyrinomonadaceae bacterium]|nr:peptide chain release factor N(5)-glutamine methyltransferase [Pyrinomonadaceae bacterium]